jgi:hypothetical protein
VEGRYRYQFAGREYVGERLSFSIVRSNGFDDWDEQLRETLGAEGGAINILVNPDNPAESVALADIRWAEFGAILLFAPAWRWRMLAAQHRADRWTAPRAFCKNTAGHCRARANRHPHVAASPDFWHPGLAALA